MISSILPGVVSKGICGYHIKGKMYLKAPMLN